MQLLSLWMSILKWLGRVVPLVLSMFNCSLAGGNGGVTKASSKFSAGNILYGEPPNDGIHGPPLAHRSYVGLTIGNSTDKDRKVIIDTLKANNITHLRLLDADAKLLHALSNTSIEVIIGIKKEEILELALSKERAYNWVRDNVAGHPWVNITAIAVGNEVYTSDDPDTSFHLLSAMMNLVYGLIDVGMRFEVGYKARVKVTAPQSIDLIPRPFPPSTALFYNESGMFRRLSFFLDFLYDSESYYMLNAYPYFGYKRVGEMFPADYVLGRPFPSEKQIVDPNTHLSYNNMLDAMIDATYSAMAALGFNKIPIVVAETGWPRRGQPYETDATADNAKTYTNNLVRRVLNGSRGTPGRPSIPVRAYLYDMFDGGPRPGRWGMFSDEGAANYDLELKNSSDSIVNSTIFCVARRNVEPDQLKSGLDWVCGQGRADCAAIQEGQPCHLPNTTEDHASFAYNDYYQRTGKGICDFNGTAIATAIDPSYGTCVFNGSSNKITNTAHLAPTAPTGPTGPTGGSINMKVSRFHCLSLISISFLALVLL